MITKLTPHQEKMIGEYYKRFLGYGLRTKPLDKDKAFEVIDGLYENIGLKKPVKFIFESPMACLIAYCYLVEFFKKFKDIETGEEIGSQIRSQIWSQIESQIWSQIRSQIGSQIGSQIRSQIESQIWSQIRSQIWSQIESQIGSQIRSQIESQIRSQIGSQNNNWWYANHNANWVGYYQYFKDIFGLQPSNEALMNSLLGTVEELHWFLPYENICILSEHPIEINRNERGLHKDGSAALLYKDGYSLWSLNGVRVPEYLAKTPEGQLDIEFFKKEGNADVKAEFIRKFGIHRMQSLGKKVCDAKEHNNEWFRRSEYELWDMGEIFEVPYAPHLRMKNLTTGIYHFEAVSPDCKSIEDALKFRARNHNIQLEGVK